jgi:hypothetical protein
MPPFRRSILSISLACCAWSYSVGAQTPDPQPPCDGTTFPNYSPVERTPAVAVWRTNELTRAGWKPPACLGWSGTSQSAAVLAAEFRFAGSTEELLTRFGALASYPSIKYWSTTSKGWYPLVTSAGVVAGPAGASTKASFDATDLMVGKDNYYFETSRQSERTVYRLRVLALTASRAVMASENVSPIRAFGFTLFEPSALQYVTFFDKHGADSWGYYQIVRTGEGTSRLAGGNEASYLNRLAALYRYMAGIPTDTEPPIAR